MSQSCRLVWTGIQLHPELPAMDPTAAGSLYPNVISNLITPGNESLTTHKSDGSHAGAITYTAFHHAGLRYARPVAAENHNHPKPHDTQSPRAGYLWIRKGSGSTPP